MTQPTETATQIEAGPQLTPLPSGPVRLERAWHYFMTQKGVTEVGYAHGVKVQRRALRSLMAGRR